MRQYSKKITFSKNSRGVYSIDPSIGCNSGCTETDGGCYNDCYAFNNAKRYGYDFSKTVERYFLDDYHLYSIKRAISRIDMPFIRMGTMGDPSENWDHTFSIIRKIRNDIQLDFFKTGSVPIVVITKHWKNLSDLQVNELIGFGGITINTSVSALDRDMVLENSLLQYDRLKNFCNSVLRIVTCDFNLSHPEGDRLNRLQMSLIERCHGVYIDTVFRPSKGNGLVVNGIINTKKKRFIKGIQIVSKKDKQSYLGPCSNCPDMCGIKNDPNN